MINMAVENIKQLRGVLWRKLQDKKQQIEQEKKEEIKLPGFEIGEIKEFTELSIPKDIHTLDVNYPLIPPFAYANIKWDNQIKQLRYTVKEPELSEDEKKTLNKISDSLIDLIEVGLTSIKASGKATEYLEKQIKKVLKELGMKLNPGQYTRIMYYIYRNFVGLNEIEPLLQDPNIEDIGCDGLEIPIYIVHRRYGSIKSNVIFSKLEDLREFVVKLSERCGRYVSYAEPILDGTLPDGSRVNATLAGDVATRGPTFSIRKFTEKPFSPVDQIDLKTVSPLTMAYFWYIIESGVSLVVAGGVATGKTSFLNTVSMFIPPESKIVSIEDTRELRLPHEHWIPSVTRLGFGIPMPTGEKYGEITLFDLLKGSFRQNPDYVIVGEVRGKEAYVMFQGMSSGHPSLGTFHAGSVDTVIKRLTTPPIELSASLVESLDAIVIMIHAKEKGKSARRIKEVEEIINVEHATLDAETFKVIEWDPKHDTYTFNKNSHLLKKIAHNKGTTIEEVWKEIARRAAILEWMTKKGIEDYIDVTKTINEYYKNPENILKQVGTIKPLPEAPKTETTKIKIEKKETEKKEIEEEKEVTKEEVEEEKTEEQAEEPAEEPEEKEEKRTEIDVESLFGFKVVAGK